MALAHKPQSFNSKYQWQADLKRELYVRYFENKETPEAIAEAVRIPLYDVKILLNKMRA